MKIRIEYSKGDRVRFLSHLDVARVMRMALFRAGWPLKMSKGFSPRPKVSFYSPLPVGTSSDGEYMDVELEDRSSALGLLARKFSDQLPQGFSLKRVDLIDPDAPSLDSLIQASKYTVSWKGGMDDIEGTFSEEIPLEIEKVFHLFQIQDQVLFEVERPSGRKMIDLRPFVLDMNVEREKAPVTIRMTLKHENGRTVRPQWILYAIMELDPGLKGRMDPKEAVVHREELLFDESQKAKGAIW